MTILGKIKFVTGIVVLAIAMPALADSHTISTSINDTVITAKVKSGLAANTIIHSGDISVETTNGVVALTGTAQSETEAAKAVEIAEATANVRDVDASGLKVLNSNQPLTDAYITSKVKGVFLKNNLIAGTVHVPVLSVKVETQQGVVFLSGDVKNRAEANQLIHLARSVNGVTRVESTVKIKN